MKLNILILIFVCVLSQSFAQKHDYYWVMGYGSFFVGSSSGGTDIDFNVDPPDTSYVFRSMDIARNSASISDTEGNLLFYTNGCYIAGADNLPLANGEGLNPGFISDLVCESAYLGADCSLILPKPNTEHIYHLFHLTFDKDSLNFFLVTKLLYTEVDMSLNNGKGGVTSHKNELILNARLCAGQLEAVKHANGYDWWIIVPKAESNSYYKFLFTANGLIGPFEQTIGNVYYKIDWNGQAVFSPDGTKYARFDTRTDLNIFDFDRCDGTLSNHRFIPMNLNSDTVVAGGVAISPNSRYIYLSATDKVFQFDLDADDIASTKTVVGVYDGFAAPFASTFYLAQLAPDNKIYINCTNAEMVLHVINAPDQPGLDCDLTLHSFYLPTYNAFTMPNFPNFRLGPTVSSCDSIISSSSFLYNKKTPIEISPNPFDNQIILKQLPISSKNKVIYLFDIIGRSWTQYVIPEGVTDFIMDTTSIPTGFYFYRIESDGNILQSGKLVKFHP